MACCLDSEEEYLPVLGISHGEKTKILCKSVLTGDIGAVKALLDTGEYEESLIFPDHHEGALHVAALHGHVDIVRMLIHHSANVNAANAFGQIPLHLACRKGYFDIVEMLLRAGSEVDYKDCGECTPLFHAVSASQTQVAQRLIDAGCDLDTLNEELITPLDQAVIFNQPEMVATLIKGGCQWEKLVGVVYPDHYTSSIFFSLWHNQDYDNIGLLLDCGFKLDHPMDPVILNTLLAICLPSEQPPFQHLSAAFKNPQSLKGCCRISIRRQLIINRYHMGKSLRSLINRLPLPRMLKSYLNFDSYPSITSMYENR